jgi:hypothetical protein
MVYCHFVRKLLKCLRIVYKSFDLLAQYLRLNVNSVEQQIPRHLPHIPAADLLTQLLLAIQYVKYLADSS